MKKILILIFVIILIQLVHSECFPEYVCGDWSDCSEDGISTRICVDKKCGYDNLIERKLCSSTGCTPEISCSPWSECTFTEKFINILNANISFGGYQERFCEDLAGCKESFTERKECTTTYPLNIRHEKQCGITYLIASDKNSDRDLAKINLDEYKKGKLYLTLLKTEESYCPSCFNGILEENEEKIDCGGDCKPCSSSRSEPILMQIFLSWFFFVFFLVLSIREFRRG